MFASREPLSLIISKTKLSCYWNNYFTVYLLEQNHASCTTTIICFNAPFPGDSRLSGYFGFPSTYFRRKPLKMISTGLVWARYLFCHPSNCQSTWLPTSGLPSMFLHPPLFKACWSLYIGSPLPLPLQCHHTEACVMDLLQSFAICSVCCYLQRQLVGILDIIS